MSSRPLPSSSVLLGEVKATVLRKYKKSASVFLENAALDMMRTEHPGDIQRYAGFYNMVYLFLDPSHCQEPNRPFSNPLLAQDSTTRFIWNKKEYDCADCLVDNDDDHPASIDTAELRSIQGPIAAPTTSTTEQVAAISKKTQKKTSALYSGENIKTRLRRVYNERKEAKKLVSWLELKATVETAATLNVPAHVSTTQWHFWNAVFLDVLPSLSAPERAARLLALESRDITDEDPEPWSDIWQTYQYVQLIGEIETTGWDQILSDLTENYQDFSEKMLDLDLATRMALGLPVALPPVREENTSVLAESTASKPSTPHTPVLETSARRPKLLPKSQTTRKNFELAYLAEKATIAPEVAAPPALIPEQASTNIFGLPASVPGRPFPPPGGFTFSNPVSRIASAHPTSVPPQSAPNAQLPDTPRFNFGFAKSTFDAPNPACAPKFNEGAGFGRDFTHQTPNSSSAEQITQLVAPIVEKTKSLSVVFGAPIVNPDSLLPAEQNLFTHLNEPTADLNIGDENGDKYKCEIPPAIKATPMGRSHEPVLDIIVEEPVEQTSREPEGGDMERNFEDDHEDDERLSRSVASTCWLTTEDDFKHIRDGMSVFREWKSPAYTVGQFVIDYVITRSLDLPAEDLCPWITEILNSLPCDHRSFVQTLDDNGVEAAASFEEALEFFEPHLVALSTAAHTEGVSATFGLSVGYLGDAEATTSVKSEPIMTVVAERQAMYEDDESYNYINGYEYLAQFDCDDHVSQADSCADIDRPDVLDELMPEIGGKSPFLEYEAGLVKSDSASTVTLTPSLTHSPFSEAELAIDTEMAEGYMLDGYGRPLELTGMPEDDKKFFDAVHTKIVAETDQYEFDWAEVDRLLGPQDEGDDDDDYVVPTIDDDGKLIKLTLDINPQQEDWAQGVLSQVFPDFEQAEAKLPNVAPQLRVEVDQTSFSAMFDSGYMSESLGIPGNTSFESAKLPAMQLVDTLMPNTKSILADYDTVLHELYPQAAAVGTEAEGRQDDYRLLSPAVHEVAFKAVSTKDPGPQDGIGTSNSAYGNLPTAQPLTFNRHHPVYDLSRSDLAVYNWLKSQPNNSLANVSANEPGEPAPFEAIKL